MFEIRSKCLRIDKHKQTHRMRFILNSVKQCFFFLFGSVQCVLSAYFFSISSCFVFVRLMFCRRADMLFLCRRAHCTAPLWTWTLTICNLYINTGRISSAVETRMFALHVHTQYIITVTNQRASNGKSHRNLVQLSWKSVQLWPQQNSRQTTRKCNFTKNKKTSESWKIARKKTAETETKKNRCVNASSARFCFACKSIFIRAIFRSLMTNA